MSMLQSRMLESCFWKLEATRKGCGYVESLQTFSVFFKLRIWVQRSRKTVEVCFSEFRMAESPKSVVVETEGVSVPTGSGSAVPMPDAGSNAMPEAPNTTTVEGLPVVPASKVTGNVSPPAPLTPMTPADKEVMNWPMMMLSSPSRRRSHVYIRKFRDCQNVSKRLVRP